MKVKAIKMGYYDHKRIREGTVFTLKPVQHSKTKEIIPVEKQFSKTWMEPVESGESKKSKRLSEQSEA